MSMSVIKRLTPAQIELIPMFRQKWREIASNSASADQSHVLAAVPILYRALGLPSPKVQFFQGPEPFYQASRNRTTSNAYIEDYELAIGRVAENVLVAVILVMTFCWVWSAFWCATQFPVAFWVAVILFFVFESSPLKSVLSSYPQITQVGNIFFGLGLCAWFLPSPVVCAWIVREHMALAWVLGSLPFVLLLVSWLTGVLERQRPASRWKQMVSAAIDHQLSRPVRQQLHQLWATDTLPEQSTSINPRGYFSALNWSYAQLSRQPYGCLKALDWVDWCSKIDFCVSVLGCQCNRPLWNALQTLIQECGLVLPLTKTLLVCDRPYRVALDTQGHLHAEGEAAIAFGDGSCIYAYRGVKLPPEYGKLHPHQWKAEWVLSEQNAEVRRALIQGISYGRLCQELGARTLDTWREYTLLRLDLPTRLWVNGQEVEEESVLLLKMTCPSTQHIHVLRVPPSLRSARAAVKWVNWDIDPKQFSIET